MIEICDCEPNPLSPETYESDELVAMPIADKYYIVHIPCGKKAREDWETD